MFLSQVIAQHLMVHLLVNMEAPGLVLQVIYGLWNFPRLRNQKCRYQFSDTSAMQSQTFSVNNGQQKWALGQYIPVHLFCALCVQCDSYLHTEGAFCKIWPHNLIIAPDHCKDSITTKRINYIFCGHRQTLEMNCSRSYLRHQTISIVVWHGLVPFLLFFAIAATMSFSPLTTLHLFHFETCLCNGMALQSKYTMPIGPSNQFCSYFIHTIKYESDDSQKVGL